MTTSDPIVAEAERLLKEWRYNGDGRSMWACDVIRQLLAPFVMLEAERTSLTQLRDTVQAIEQDVRQAAESFGRKSLSLDAQSAESAATAAAAVLLRDVADALGRAAREDQS